MRWLAIAAALFGLIIASGAKADGYDPTLSQITGVSVTCYTPDEWAAFSGSYGDNIAGLTLSVWVNGSLVSGPDIHLPQWVCDDTRLAPTQPTPQNVLATRIVGHEWGNAQAALTNADNTGENFAECYGQAHFWDILNALGLNDGDTDTMSALSSAEMTFPPATTCFAPYIPAVTVPQITPEVKTMAKPFRKQIERLHSRTRAFDALRDSGGRKRPGSMNAKKGSSLRSKRH